MLKKSHVKKEKTYSASNGINDDYKETEYWVDRVWLYGAGAFECVPEGEPVR
jgi:hypothetical protein